MRREYSGYLDLVRFTSALLVFFSHMTESRFIGGVIPYQGETAGLGVMAFFVLSGYVISYVSTTKERTLRSFAVSRLARIYSVVIPALALTIAVDLLALHYGWGRAVPDYQYRSFFTYLTSALTFTDQSQFLAEPTFGNRAFWSLDYEVWYYVLFAGAAYYGGWKRLVLLPIILFLAGPRVLVYLPLWLAGVAVFHLHSRVTISDRLAAWLFFASLFAVAALRVCGVDQMLDAFVKAALGGWPQRHMQNSQNFASHYTLVVLIAINLFAANYMRLRIFANQRVASAIVYVASFTFALYLMHMPFLDLYANVFHHNPHSWVSWAGLAVSVLFSIWLVGFITEHRKRDWRRFFQWLLDAVHDRAATYFPALLRIVSTAAVGSRHL